MGGMGLPGLWLFLALVVAASVFLAVGSVWLANKAVRDIVNTCGSAIFRRPPIQRLTARCLMFRV